VENPASQGLLIVILSLSATIIALIAAGGASISRFIHFQRLYIAMRWNQEKKKHPWEQWSDKELAEKQRKFKIRTEKKLAVLCYLLFLSGAIGVLWYTFKQMNILSALSTADYVRLGAFLVIVVVILVPNFLFFRQYELIRKKSMGWLGRTLKHSVLLNFVFSVIAIIAFLWKVIDFAKYLAG
jgi:hypothetical protein